MAGGKGYIGRGYRMALRDWPCFAWLYLANLLLAVVASAGLGAQMGNVLNTSLAAGRLARGFDVTVLFELLVRPEVTPRASTPTSMLCVLLFALITLFLTAGIVQSFLSDEHLRMGAFFQACGAWLWRFTRLALLTWIILGPVLGVLNALRAALVSWADKSPDPRLSFYVGLAGLLVIGVVAIFLRLWFDLAQFHLVHTGERKVRRGLPAGFRLLRQGCFRLFGIYFFISLVGWIGLAAGLWVWMKWVPPAGVGRAFLVGQAILVLWLFTRYWQRAAEALWFREHAPAPVVAQLREPAPVPPQPAPVPTFV